jgi:hypothetical protein
LVHAILLREAAHQSHSWFGETIADHVYIHVSDICLQDIADPVDVQAAVFLTFFKRAQEGLGGGIITLATT